MTDLNRGLYFENTVGELHYREVLKHVYKLEGQCGHDVVTTRRFGGNSTG